MGKKQTKEIKYSAVVYDTVFEEVMHNSMIPYSESVILDRALPRVEDGLKPVQRRILYAMHEMGLTPDKPYKKSARIVGDCLGKYHPHGDSSVYGAMVRMAQPFSMRMKLVDGHGNFGSVDGDPAAAMRYTEARMSPLALELLRDLDKDTVSWNPNFDDSLQEPNMLPGRFPNLLVNGANGIAVGLATNIPPHNMGECIDAVVMMIDNKNVTLKELFTVFKGPDFPTGGTIIPVDSLESIYETGKGRIKIRSRVHIEEENGGKKSIVVTEMPYQVSKADLLAKIADLRDSGKENKDALSGISEIVDESDKTGMRAVIRCKKDADIKQILAILFKKTNLELGYSVNMVAIANGKPEILGLREILKYYIEYQREVIVRRTRYDLKAARQRAEIVRGLLVAIRNIDEVIRIIKSSESTQKAKLALAERFDLTDEQAQAIVDMRLKALTHLEVGRLEEELAALEKKIEYLSAILASEKKQYRVVRDEILEIKKNMKSARMTVIAGTNEAAIDDVPTAQEAEEYKEGILALNCEGTLRFLSQKSYSTAQRDMSAYGAAELAVQAVTVNNKGVLLAVTDGGTVIKVNVSDLPDKKWRDRGVTAAQLSRDVQAAEKVVKLLFFNSSPVGEIVFFTEKGMVKRTDLAEFAAIKSATSGIILADKDRVINAEVVDDERHILEVTKNGLCLLYSALEVPLQGRKAGGVKGIKLNDGDSVAYAGQVEEEGEIVVATDKGCIKRVITPTLEVGSRYLKGVKLIETADSSVTFVDYVKMPYNIAVVGGGETKIVNTEEIRIDTRTTKGKQMFKQGIDLIVKLES